MTIPALVHQMPFYRVSEWDKRENDRHWGGGRHGWHLTTPKHRNGEPFSKRPRVLTTVKGERQSDIGDGIGVMA